MGGDKPANGADDGWSPHRLPVFTRERGDLVGTGVSATGLFAWLVEITRVFSGCYNNFIKALFCYDMVVASHSLGDVNSMELIYTMRHAKKWRR